MMRSLFVLLVLSQQFATVVAQTPGDIYSPDRNGCLQVMGTGNGAQVRLQNCSPSQDAQKYVFEPVNSNYYLIKPEHVTNKCLTVLGSSVLNDASIVLGDCPDAYEPAFHFKLSGHYGERYIVNENSFKCTELNGSDVLVQHPCENRLLQQFEVDAELHPLDASPNIGFPGLIESMDKPDMCLYLAALQHRDNIHLEPCAPGVWQQEFKMILAPSGDYWIQADMSDLCVAARRQNGVLNIRQNTCFNKNFILWELIPRADGGYQLRNKLYQTCMIAATDNNIILGPCTTGNTNNDFLIRAPIPGMEDDDIMGSPPNAAPNAAPVTPNPTAVPHFQIEWSDVVPMDQTPAAAANLPNGDIMTWSSYTKLQFGKFQGQTWVGRVDPTSSTYNAAANSFLVQTNHDMFCPGTAILPDGRIMVSGGSKGQALTFYLPEKDLWVRGADMAISRGYHSMTTLGDGRVLTIGGSWIDGRVGAQGNKHGEVWDPMSNDWTTENGWNATKMLTNDKDGVYRQDNHFWMFQAPDGNVFHAGPSAQAHWIDVDNGQESVTDSTVIRRNAANEPIDTMVGVALMFDIGKILTLGGAPDYRGGYSVKHSHVIDLGTGKGTETVTRVGDMFYSRCNTNAVVLPTGNVIVIGGQNRSRLFTDLASVLHAEMWDPATGQWTVLNPPMQTPRNYHSVALLMIDGRVFSAGGGLCGDSCGDANHPDYHILTPPYLLNSDGSPATRPVILFSESRIPVTDNTLDVIMDSSEDHTFALCRLGAITHSTNTDTRRIPIVGTWIPNPEVTDQFTFQLALPADRNILVPGQYYLFAMNADGTPSIGKHVTVDGVAGGIEPPTTDTIQATKLAGDPCVAPVGDFFSGDFNMGTAACVDRLAEQYYTFENITPTSIYYRVRVGSTGRCLEVSGSSTTSGADVIQGPCGDSDHQVWEVSGSGVNQQLKNKNSGLCLTVQSGNMIQGGCSPGNSNTFDISSEL